MNDKWNGESRGCADVMFSRIQILMRTKGYKGHYSNLFDAVTSLVTHCEEKDVRLTDILEDVYLQIKEDVDEERKDLG